MEQSKDPLSSLFTSDAKAVDRRKLADLLKSFVMIDETSKEISFHNDFHSLKGNIQKIEVILATTKAKSLFFNEEDGVSPGDIISLGVMPEGSVKTSLKKLLDTHKIKKNKSGKYFIPAYRIKELAEQLQMEPSNHD